MCNAVSRIRIEMPMVMITIRSTEGLWSQRMKTISMIAPTIVVMTTAARMASGRGRTGAA